MRSPLYVSVALLLAAPAFADSIRKNLAQAADRLEEAISRDDRGGRRDCRKRIEREIGRLVDTIDDLRPSDDVSKFDQVATQLSDILSQARRASCDDDMVRDVTRALGELTDAQSDMRRRRPGDSPPPPPPPSQAGVAFPRAEVVEQGGAGPVVTIPTIELNGFQNSNVYYAWHWRPEGGGWSPWESLPAFAVNSPSFVWANPYRQILDYGILRAADTGSGRFTVHAGVFDMNGRELGSTDVNFTAHYPRQVSRPPRPMVLSMNIVPPPPPPQNLPPPPPGNALPPAPPLNAQARDCGLGADDPGCSLTRGGGTPMDRATWEGFWSALKGNASESGRLGMVRDTCRAKFITARQLGALMEAFVGENNKLDMVRECSGHVVDPNNALGLATKFASTSRQREFNQIMTSQR